MAGLFREAHDAPDGTARRLPLASDLLSDAQVCCAPVRETSASPGFIWKSWCMPRGVKLIRETAAPILCWAPTRTTPAAVPPLPAGIGPLRGEFLGDRPCWWLNGLLLLLDDAGPQLPPTEQRKFANVCPGCALHNAIAPQILETTLAVS
mmetsp:Transcript_54517/g.152009  ORF Transcript_54517/g.152009 Transcript_54517/m.152009 type:complete len:150 (+) Transcript_54517:1837-2286(+)